MSAASGSEGREAVTTPRVLVIEDDPDIAQLVRLHIADLPAEVKIAADGIVGLAEAESRPYELVILDLKLPGMDGLEICRRLRAKGSYTPILMLTSKSSELERVLGLEMGADDYLTKPFSVLELTARVKAILRRMNASRTPDGEAPQRIQVRDLEIDLDRRTVVVRGESVTLTAKEFDLLAHFARHPGRVFTRDQLLDQVWGYQHSGYEHTVNSHINRLRAKIERDAQSPEYVQTVWGVGYKFNEAR